MPLSTSPACRWRSSSPNRRSVGLRSHGPQLRTHMSAERSDGLRELAAVTALTCAGCALWLYRLGANDYDWVIAEEVLFARQPLARLIFHNRWPDQSPVPFVVMRAARVFGEGPFAVSLPNVLL